MHSTAIWPLVAFAVGYNTLHIADKTIKLWKVSERDKKAEGYNLKEDSGLLRDPSTINTLRVNSGCGLVLLFGQCPMFTGPCTKANGVDGGSLSEKNFCQRPHLSHQFHFNQLRRRNILVCR